MGLSGCYGWQEHAQAIPLISSQMWVESHAVYAFFIAWGRLHAIEEYTVFANYGSNNLPWLFGHCLCQDRPFVLCCSSCVQPNTVRLLCRRDFLYGGRSQYHGLRSFVEVPPELCSTIIPGRIGVFLRQQQFVLFDLCTSSHATHRNLSEHRHSRSLQQAERNN